VCVCAKIDAGLVFGKWICLDILKDEDEMKWYRGADYNVRLISTCIKH